MKGDIPVDSDTTDTEEDDETIEKDAQIFIEERNAAAKDPNALLRFLDSDNLTHLILSARYSPHFPKKNV